MFCFINNNTNNRSYLTLIIINNTTHINMKLKARFPNKAKVVTIEGTDKEVTLANLFDALFDDAPTVESIKVGIPPRPVVLDDVSAPLATIGIRNGDQIHVAPGDLLSTSPEIESNQTTSSKQSSSNPLSSKKQIPTQGNNAKPGQNSVQVRAGRFGFLRLRVMEDDNSCLFRAVNYGINPLEDMMRELRAIVAKYIRADPEKYSDAILGKPREEYIRWIQTSNAWGGAIELDILARHFDITIVSLDVATLRKDFFNEGQDNFIVIVYSGIHYDAVALVPSEDDEAGPEFDTTIFTVDEKGSEVLEQLGVLGQLLKQKHYYTDTGSFELRCDICNAIIVGEKGADEHAKATGHTSFKEL